MFLEIRTYEGTLIRPEGLDYRLPIQGEPPFHPPYIPTDGARDEMDTVGLNIFREGVNLTAEVKIVSAE